MRVPQSPHNLRKFVSTSSSESDNDSSSESEKTMGKKPPKPFSKKKELRPSENATTGTFVSANRGRERTRISAVQRLVERKMAQKEREKEKERDTLFRRSSSVGSNVKCENSPNLSRSLSRERLDTSKTYIRISSKNSSIREVSPTKRVTSDTTEKLSKIEPLKSTEIFKDLTSDKKGEQNNNEPEKPQRKISFTTEKTILINDNATIREDPKVRKVSIDINYVYEHQHVNEPFKMKDEKLDHQNDASKRRISLERRFQERSSSLSRTS